MGDRRGGCGGGVEICARNVVGGDVGVMLMIILTAIERVMLLFFFYFSSICCFALLTRPSECPQI